MPVDARLLASSVRPNRVNTPSPLETLALGRQEDRQNRQLDQRDAQIQQRDQQIEQNQNRIDTAAQKLGLDKRQFAQQVLGEVVQVAKSADEAQQLMEYYTQIPVPPEMQEQLRAMEENNLLGRAEPTTAQRDRADLLKGLTPEQQRQAREVEAGIRPRAVGNAQTTIASGESGVTAEQVADVAGTIKAGERAGAAAIEQSGDAIKQLASVRKNIGNIDDAIAALDEGANTGAIMSRLPSITQASVELDNARSRLGLDVIGAVTFGALSKGELDLALNTAIPTGLDGPQLREWLVAKKNAQTKMAQELEGAAIFLGQPGNTPADYLQLLRDSGGFSLSDDTPLTPEEQAELEALEAEFGER